MDLLTQLNNAIAYIEEHIADDLLLHDVSKVTTYSAFHFGRLFYYIADIPLAEYIRRRKLSLAAIELQDGHKVIDLAVKYGYDSADSFTRAFIKQHGITPSITRKQGAVLVNFPPITFQIKIEGVQGMNWRIENKEAFRVVGIERRFGNEETDLIPGFWQELSENGSLERLKTQTGGTSLMATCSHIDDKKNDFSYLIGMIADENAKTDGFTTLKAPASVWAVFRSEEFDENPYGSEIPKLFKSAYQEWLPSSGYHKAESEVYDMEFCNTTGNGKFYEEVWLSVVKG